MVLFIIFFIGLCVGSFLNVLIDRLPREESIIKKRSYCESCKHKLAWYDLIPLLSFVMLSGKCRYCGFPISFYYPTVELITGVLFVLTFFFLPGESILYYLFIVSSLITIFFIDLKYGIIPDKIVYPSIFLTFVFIALNTQYLILNTLLSAFGSFLFFLFLWAITRGRGMGFGDVKYTFLMGLILGFPNIVVGLYVAFLTGAIVSLILVLWGKKKLKGSTIPFGPFLVFGTIVALFWGDILMRMVLPWLSLSW